MKVVDALEPHVKKFQKELAAGTVSLVLLATLARSAEPRYGYQIAKELEAADPELAGGKQSALYPVLRNLSTAGLLESWVEPSVAGPPRRYYRITDAGRIALRQWQASWQAMRDFVETILERSSQP